MSPTDTCVARVPIFQGLTSTEQQEVATFAKPRVVSKGDMLCTAATPISRLFVVHSGLLKISRITAQGREQIIRTVTPGEVVGERAFLTGEISQEQIVALEDSRICTFEHQDLSTLLAQYPDVGARMLRTLSDRLASVERLLASVTSSDVEARVAAYLLDLPQRFAGNQMVVTLPMAKHEVAAYLGTTPETVSRKLSSLVKQRAISLRSSREIAIVDPEALRELAANTL